jgi:hypothetical protein
MMQDCKSDTTEARETSENVASSRKKYRRIDKCKETSARERERERERRSAPIDEKERRKKRSLEKREKRHMG